MNETPPSYVILGATGGIGSALTRRLAATGARLVIAGRDGDRLAALAGETGATPQLFDATELTAVERCVNLGVERHRCAQTERDGCEVGALGARFLARVVVTGAGE